MFPNNVFSAQISPTHLHCRPLRTTPCCGRPRNLSSSGASEFPCTNSVLLPAPPAVSGTRNLRSGRRQLERSKISASGQVVHRPVEGLGFGKAVTSNIFCSSARTSGRVGLVRDRHPGRRPYRRPAASAVVLLVVGKNECRSDSAIHSC